MTLEKKQCADVLLVLFSTVMLILITIFVSSTAVLSEAVCRITSDYHGGSAAYWASESAAWYITLRRVAIFMLQLMSDALWIHRCRVIWDSTRVVVVPSILWFVTLGLGVAQNWMFGTIVHHDGYLLPSPP
ncbi:hypothetical protein OG21DRAFT_780920 [Imleria badia]|nr:hypothetical protein OG21DRAFT_780920 [Imleria badia]